MELQYFTVTYAGESSDGRTNKWQVRCKKCKKTYIPPSTRLAEQLLECSKCDIKEIVNYNKL